jgi:hypothetical protein
MRLSILFALVLLAGCTHAPQPAPLPAPPPVAAKVPVKPGPPRPGDIVVRNCTVTKEANGRADCICRHANTHIDANDTTKQALVCR